MGASAKLDRTVIVTAAFEVLAAVGLDGLSLRRVADRLGVQAPALYWHVSDKAELISLMAVTLSRTPSPGDLAGNTWREKLVQSARMRRRSMLKLRDSARVCVVAQPFGSTAEMRPQLTAALLAAGLTGRQALAYQAAVSAYTVGWVAYEQNRALQAFLTQPGEIEEGFEAGLRAMVSAFG